MALPFITALLMSADRRQSQSSRKFAWTELHLSRSWWEAEGGPVHSLTLQPSGMVQPALPHWGIWALSCSAEPTPPKSYSQLKSGTLTVPWKSMFPIRLLNNLYKCKKVLTKEVQSFFSTIYRVFQDPNPFLSPSIEPDALLRSAVPPLVSKEQGRLGSSGRSLAPLHFPSELLPFDEALRDVCTIRPLGSEGDVVARHGGQLLEIKAAERRG